MKKSILVLAASALVIISCNNSSSNADSSKESYANEKAIQSNDNVDVNVKTVSPTFRDVNAGVATFMKSLVQNYLTIKNALVKDDSTSAATASVKLKDEMKIFNKSLPDGQTGLFTAAEKKIYDSVESNLKEQAEDISKSKLADQRQHFFIMSKDVYTLVKAFNPGITLYGDNCPMYNNGALWLSEIKEIRNPYLGKEMPGCGSVEEKFQ